jgi:hypothetical protein
MSDRRAVRGAFAALAFKVVLQNGFDRGIGAGDNSGYSVASACNVDGDGKSPGGSVKWATLDASAVGQ